MNESTTMLPISDVYANEENYRDVTPAGIKEIAASIADAGQLEAIEVWADGEIYRVIDGNHRLAAMKHLGCTEIAAKVLPHPSESVAAVRMVAHNVHVPVNDIERSKGAQLMFATGVKPESVSAHLGYSPDDAAKAEIGWKRFHEFSGETAEPTSIERFIALAEFADDTDAVEELLHADEKNVIGIVSRLRRARDLTAAIETAKATIIDAGCEVILTQGEGQRFISRDGKAPDGAKWGRVVDDGWSRAYVNWYGEASEDETEADREAARERERREELQAIASAARAARIEFVRGYITNEFATVKDDMRMLCESFWNDGQSSWIGNVASELEGITGFFPRIYASLYSVMDSRTALLLSNSDSEYNAKQYGRVVVRYLEALKATGLELAECETELIAHLRSNHPCPECGGDGRPLCADGSHNGNKACSCGGTGVAS